MTICGHIDPAGRACLRQWPCNGEHRYHAEPVPNVRYNLHDNPGPATNGRPPMSKPPNNAMSQVARDLLAEQVTAFGSYAEAVTRAGTAASVMASRTDDVAAHIVALEKQVADLAVASAVAAAAAGWRMTGVPDDGGTTPDPTTTDPVETVGSADTDTVSRHEYNRVNRELTTAYDTLRKAGDTLTEQVQLATIRTRDAERARQAATVEQLTRERDEARSDLAAATGALLITDDTAPVGATPPEAPKPPATDDDDLATEENW